MKKIKLFLAAFAAMVGLSASAQSWTGSVPAEGDFYLYNVGAAKFLNAGDRAANWGTNATLSAIYGLDFTLEANGLDFNLNSKNSNGGQNNYLATSLWTDGGATPWTFTSVGDKVYTISNSTNYLAANAAGNDVELVTSSDDDNAKWILLSRENVITGIASATKDNPINISFLLGAPDFNRNDTRAANGRSWTWTNTGGNVTVAGPNAERGTFGCEFWNNPFDIYQTLTGMPDGMYEFKIAGYGTNGTTYIYGNSTEVAFVNTTSAADFSTALNNIADGQYSGNTTGRFTVIGGTVKVGVKRTNNKSSDWAVFDNAELIYYGLDLSDFEDALAAAVQAAEAVEGTVPTAAYNVLAAVVAEKNQTYTSAADYTAATTAIETATNTAKALQPGYNRYQAVRAAVLAISSSIDVSTADAQLNEAVDNDGINTAVATVRTALAAYLPTVELAAGETIDLTDALIDNAAPGVSETTDYWTNSGTPALQFNLYEYYNVSGATTKQTIATQLPAGNYKLTAVAFTRTGYVARLNAGAVTTNIATVSNSEVNNRDQGNTWIAAGNGVTDLVFNLAEATENLEIGLTADNANGDHWMCWRSFRLVYGDVFEAYTLVDGKMNATVAATQTEADNAFKSNPSPTTYMSVKEAIAAAESSVAAYAIAAAALADANALKDAHNFVTASAATTFAEAIVAVQAKYDNGTLTNDEANAGGSLGTVVTGHRGGANTAASNFMESTFGLTDFEAALYVNTWSTEGATDGSNFKVPFYEYWVADANSLGENTWTATLSGIDNGLYSVSAWVRVRAKNGVAAGEATGITMDVNGGGEGDYAAVDVTAGKQIGSSQFQIATYTAQGLVKDGTLTLNFNVAADNNISWLSFKNITYTKVRDLTDDEAAIIPTAIALYNGETEVTSDIELDATTTSVTLTPSFTPADATPSVTWASSDETVATVSNGVVTAVAPGTATITVTSTLDASVSATATVTVDFPETATPASYYVNSDATRTVYSVGENLIKNGTFEYPDGFYGWTDAQAGAAKLTSSNFDIVTEGENKYLKSKNHGGSTAASSIGTAWPIEAGKTYVFGYKAKAVNAGTTEYHVVSLTNTLATETSKISTTQTVGTDWTDIKYTFTNTGNYAYLQFRARWLGEKGQLSSFDDFYLAEVTPTTEGNVDYATAAIPTANVGTGAFQYSQDAIDAANALVQGTATVEDVTNAYNALTTLNEPAAGDVFNIMITTNDTYGFKNNPLTFNADNASGAYFGQNVGVKAHFAQQVVFTKVEGNKYTISTVNANNDAVYVGTNKTINNSGNTGQIRLTTDPAKALAIQIVPTSEGVYNLLNTENSNNKLGCQDNPSEKTTGGLFTCNVHNDFTITPATKPSVSMVIDASVKYGTRIFPFSAAKPEGITLYTCESINGATLELTTADAIVANTPYIIYAEEGYTGANLEGFGAATVDTYTEGLLTGVYTSTVVPVGSYVLQKNNEKVAFYLVEENEEPTANANRAYLTAPSVGGGVKASAFYFGTATVIRSLFNGLQNGDVYDLAGRKVQKMQKGGVYIVNGQKVAVK